MAGFVTSFVVAYWGALTDLKTIHFQWIFFLSAPIGLVVGSALSVLPGDRYYMFYVGHHSTLTEKGQVHIGPSSFCYAESDDGIHWRKPNLGLCEFQGSKANNIMMDPATAAHALHGSPCEHAGRRHPALSGQRTLVSHCLTFWKRNPI